MRASKGRYDESSLGVYQPQHMYACSLLFCVCEKSCSSTEIGLLRPSKHNKNLNSAGFQEMRKSVCGWRKNIKGETLLA